MILAGIIFNSLLGDNGLLNRASRARAVWRNAEANEDIALGELANKIDEWESGGPGGSTLPTGFGIGVRIYGGGTVITDKLFAEAGEIVTLTITPNVNYILSDIWAYQSSKPAEFITLDGSGTTRTFTMPAFDVTIVATFPGLDNTNPVWSAAIPLIEATTFTMPQEAGSSGLEIRYYLSELVNQLIETTGFIVSPLDIVVYIFQPAVPGDAVTPLGTNGSCEFRISPSGTFTSAYSARNNNGNAFCSITHKRQGE